MTTNYFCFAVFFIYLVALAYKTSYLRLFQRNILLEVSWILTLQFSHYFFMSCPKLSGNSCMMFSQHVSSTHFTSLRYLS